jgi:penicillin-insensitive murein endopeptidase
MVVSSFGKLFIAMGALALVSYPELAEGRPRAGTVADGHMKPARSRRPLALVPRPVPLFPSGIAPWREVQAPSPGPAQAYGMTTSGCLAGAVALPARGVGFIRRRPLRRTGFGHPDLVAYVERLGEVVRHAGLGTLVIGDMSLPRGGAYMQGHTSHQTGLDVDIGYQSFAAFREVAQRETSHLPPTAAAFTPRESRRIEALLRLAAADEHVDRIFVGAGIKQRLCRTAVGDRSFLDVLRPWVGHDQHFHVRLKCPKDSPDCRPNEPVTSIPDSCEALSTWRQGTNVQAAYASWRAAERISYARNLPDACRGLAAPTRSTAMSPAAPARRKARMPGRRPLLLVRGY